METELGIDVLDHIVLAWPEVAGARNLSAAFKGDELDDSEQLPREQLTRLEACTAE